MTTQPNENEFGYLFSAEQVEVLRKALNVIYPPTNIPRPQEIDAILNRLFPDKLLDLNEKDFNELLELITDKRFWAEKEYKLAVKESKQVLNRFKASFMTLAAYNAIICVFTNATEDAIKEYLKRTANTLGIKVPTT